MGKKTGVRGRVRPRRGVGRSPTRNLPLLIYKRKKGKRQKRGLRRGQYPKALEPRFFTNLRFLYEVNYGKHNTRNSRKGSDGTK